MDWIHHEIQARGGAVPFDVYMELALYHPRHGYYSSARPRFGRGGDFLTAPSASPWYARVVARFLTAIARPEQPLRLLDVASGDGAFIAGVLASTADLGTVGEVVSVERSPTMRQLQHERFAAAAVPVVVAADLDRLDQRPMTTLVHASELYDALPVVRAAGAAGGVVEWWVACEGHELVWQQRPPRPAVERYLDRYQVVLDDGQIADIHLAAEPTHRRLLRCAGDDAVVLVLDYGYGARRLFDPRGRRFGSLSTFRDHRCGRDPLADPGRLDLTAHINWDDLRAAAAGSWIEIGHWALAEFLVRAGLAAELEACGVGMEADLDADTVSARQEVKRLLDPEGMGSDLKMLVQATGDLLEVARTTLSLNPELGSRKPM